MSDWSVADIINKEGLGVDSDDADGKGKDSDKADDKGKDGDDGDGKGKDSGGKDTDDNENKEKTEEVSSTYLNFAVYTFSKLTSHFPFFANTASWTSRQVLKNWSQIGKSRWSWQETKLDENQWR